MLKRGNTRYRTQDGRSLTVRQLYNSLKKRRGRAVVKASAIVTMHTQEGEELDARIVFAAKKGASRDWVAILSTDTGLDDEEILRLYGIRWDIECFFKVAKSNLGLAKEFMCRNYDSLVGATTVVFLRYCMISVDSRRTNDHRSCGAIGLMLVEEAASLGIAEAVQRIFECLVHVLHDIFLYNNEFLELLVGQITARFPLHIKACLGL